MELCLEDGVIGIVTRRGKRGCSPSFNFCMLPCKRSKYPNRTFSNSDKAYRVAKEAVYGKFMKHTSLHVVKTFFSLIHGKLQIPKITCYANGFTIMTMPLIHSKTISKHL